MDDIMNIAMPCSGRWDLNYVKNPRKAGEGIRYFDIEMMKIWKEKYPEAWEAFKEAVNSV